MRKGFPDDSPLMAGFRRSERQLRVRLARLGALLAILLMPTGGVLDYLTYADGWVSFLLIRILCVLLLLPIVLLLYSRWARRFGTMLAVLLGALPALAICGIIYLADGASSPYYVGLILIMVAVTQLLQSFREAFFISVLIIGAYCLVCVLHDNAEPQTVFAVNLVILVMTGAVCIVVCDLNATRRFNEFRLAYDLEAKRRELTELDQLKSQFFANVSHELRTPLTLILAPVESLLHRQPPLPQETGQQLHLIRRNGLRLLALINDLLDLIRMERATLELDRRPIAIAQLLGAVFETMRDSARRNGIELTFQGAACEAQVLGDEMRLERAFLNLLSNAIKFTPKGGSIRLRIRRRAQMACVEIQDTGIGIPAAELPRIFDRYYQVRDPAVTSRQGLGIGLHLTRELVRAHGGTIEVSSQANQGTSFTIALPLLVEEEPGVARRTSREESLQPARDLLESGGKSRDGAGDSEELGRYDPADSRPLVLVIDDEPDMRRYLVSILQERYRVVAASSAERGLEVAQQCSPNLVVLDLMLPGMDGLEACSRFRAGGMPPDMKIVMLTAKIDEGTKITALRRGADDFLTKPFNSIEVQTRVEKLLETAQLQASLRTKNRELEATLAQLRQTEANLVQSEKMNALGKLAAGLLHEINNPLNYTLLAVQISERSLPDDEDLRENLRDIREGITRVSDIISDLRAFAYPEQAGHHTQFQIKEAINTATRFTSHQLEGIAVTIPDGDMPLVLGSRTLISQVFVNLIANAVDAVRDVPAGREPEIAIEAVQNHSHLIFHVRDNGTGIDPSVQSKIFDPFFTTKPEGQGIGLGLSVCHTIVRQHGGDLQVKSVPGQGTTISFTLPLAEAKDVDYE